MKNLPIGILLESFRLPFPQAMDKARELGVQGIRVYARHGEFSTGAQPGKKTRLPPPCQGLRGVTPWCRALFSGRCRWGR